MISACSLRQREGKGGSFWTTERLDSLRSGPRILSLMCAEYGIAKGDRTQGAWPQHASSMLAEKFSEENGATYDQQTRKDQSGSPAFDLQNGQARGSPRGNLGDGSVSASMCNNQRFSPSTACSGRSPGNEVASHLIDGRNGG